MLLGADHDRTGRTPRAGLLDRRRVAGMDAASGNVLWEYPFASSRWVEAIITPSVHRDRLFLSMFGDGSLMLRLGTERLTVEKLWQRRGESDQDTDALHILMANPHQTDGYVYGVDSYGQFRCLDAATGDRVWEDLTVATQIRWGTVHMVSHGEEVWMFNDRGELLITRLSPKGLEKISVARLIKPTKGQLSRRDGVTWSHPAFAYRHVFIRNDVELVCAAWRPSTTSRRRPGRRKKGDKPGLCAARLGPLGKPGPSPVFRPGFHLTSRKADL